TKAPAKSNAPSTWGSFDQAMRRLKTNTVDGIGFELANGLAGVDLDDCRDTDTGAIESWARDIIDAFATYTEISPSGTGVKLFLRGAVPPGRKRRDKIEIYSEGRSFTVTGQHLEGTPRTVEPRQEQLDALQRTLGPEPKATGKQGPSRNGATHL